MGISPVSKIVRVENNTSNKDSVLQPKDLIEVSKVESNGKYRSYAISYKDFVDSITKSMKNAVSDISNTVQTPPIVMAATNIGVTGNPVVPEIDNTNLAATNTSNDDLAGPFAEMLNSLSTVYVTLSTEQNISANKTFSGDFVNISSLTANNLEVNKSAIYNCNIEAANHDIECRYLVGIATSAQWADLAELYEADDIYEPGTLVTFGGTNEITIATDIANAVVTSEPGFILNSTLKNGTGIALAGRTPVKVIGKVNKFDPITLSEIPGVGKVADKNCHYIIARALKNKDTTDIGAVECVTSFSL